MVAERRPTLHQHLQVELSIAENAPQSTTLPATDAEGNEITYSISGDDAALFSLNAATGRMS